MARPCNLLDAELALDRVEAEIAVALPPYVRGWSHAYAAGQGEPAPPEAIARARSVEIVDQAMAHPVLADRAIALLRLVAPTVVEADRRVAMARGAQPRSIAAYRSLAAAREVVARERFGRGHRALVHALAGVAERVEPRVAAPPVEGWTREDGADLAIDGAWSAIAAHFAIDSAPTIVRADARPRAFVVIPGREVIVVVPRTIGSPQARFAVAHELGHAVGALASAAALPRAVDEAIASHVARLALETALLGAAWRTPLAAAARARRLAIAHDLDAIEAGAATTDAPPPWALWHDPQAQAAYIAAEAIADAFTDGPIAPQLAAATARADRAFA